MAVTRDYMALDHRPGFSPRRRLDGVYSGPGSAIGDRADRKIRLILGLAMVAAGTWLMSGFDLFMDKLAGSPRSSPSGPPAGPDGLARHLHPTGGARRAAGRLLGQHQEPVPACLLRRGRPHSVLIERRTDARFDSMRQLLTPNRPPTLDVYRGLVDYLTLHGFSPGDATPGDPDDRAVRRENATVYADPCARPLC